MILDLKSKIYKLGKVADRIPIQQLTRSKNKKQKETEIWPYKLGKRLNFWLYYYWCIQYPCPHIS